MEQPASYVSGYMYFGPQATVSGAMLVDSSSEQGRDLGFFKDLHSPRQYVERASSSTWVSLTTTSAHATMTTTLTSTVVTCTAVCGPAYVPYVSGFPQEGGLISVHPMRPAVVSQSVELSGSFPRAWAGSVNHHAQSGTSRQFGVMRPPAVVAHPSSIEVKS